MLMLMLIYKYILYGMYFGTYLSVIENWTITGIN